MTSDERLALERLYNLVHPARLVVDVRHDQGWQPIAIFEEVARSSDGQDGLRVQAATVYLNDQRLNALHPENEKQYHLAQLLCAAVNALPELLRELKATEPRIEFVLAGASESGKTQVWEATVADGTILGVVSFFGRWRCYTFSPRPNTVFDKNCLREIADFCDERTKKWRAAK